MASSRFRSFASSSSSKTSGEGSLISSSIFTAFPKPTCWVSFRSAQSGSIRAGPDARWITWQTFNPRPPVETDHRKRHLIDRYLDVLIPLEIEKAERLPTLKTRAVRRRGARADS